MGDHAQQPAPLPSLRSCKAMREGPYRDPACLLAWLAFPPHQEAVAALPPLWQESSPLRVLPSGSLPRNLPSCSCAHGTEPFCIQNAQGLHRTTSSRGRTTFQQGTKRSQRRKGQKASLSSRSGGILAGRRRQRGREALASLQSGLVVFFLAKGREYTDREAVSFPKAGSFLQGCLS